MLGAQSHDTVGHARGRARGVIGILTKGNLSVTFRIMQQSRKIPLIIDNRVLLSTLRQISLIRVTGWYPLRPA